MGLIAVVASACQALTSLWWTAPLVAFLVELVFGKGDKLAFFTGFYGVAIPWMILAIWIDRTTDSVLTYRVLGIFGLPPFAFVLVLVTGLIGGISAGLSSLAGGTLKAILRNDE